VNVDLEDRLESQAATITSLEEELGRPTGPTVEGGGPVEVYRETGAEPLRFNEGYGVDLDTLDDDWGIARGSSTRDLDLATSSEGLRLSTPAGVVSVMGGDGSYEACTRTTDLQLRLSTSETVAGTKFCMKTNRGRWAFVTILDIDRVAEAIILDIVVWAPEV
jgi:hypothetical protein